MHDLRVNVGGRLGDEIYKRLNSFSKGVIEMKKLLVVCCLVLAACSDTTGPEIPKCTVFFDLSVTPPTVTHTGDCSMLDTTLTTITVSGDTLSG